MIAEGRGRSFRRLSRTWYLGCCVLDAMKYGRWEDVHALTKIQDLDPNVLVPEYGIAPMHCAAGIEPEEFGLKCVQAFLKIGGDPNVKCSEGVTPVHVACCWGRVQVLKCLLKIGGDPHIIDDDGNDAFYYADNKGKINKLLADLDDIKKKNGQGGDMITPTKFLTRFPNYSREESQDLDLNLEAYSLMLKHRKSVSIFESYPEDDEVSTTTLEEATEDFAYNPKEVEESSIYVGYKGFNVDPEVGHLETWTNKSDDEICTENILEADKTHVIQVINENINNSLSASSLSDGKSDLKENIRPRSAKSEFRYSHKSDTSVEESANYYERVEPPLKRCYSQLIDERSTVSGVKSEERIERLRNKTIDPDKPWNDHQHSFDFNTNYNFNNKCEQEGTLCEKTEVHNNDSSTNIIGITNGFYETMATPKDSVSSTKKISRSTCSSMKSESEGTNYMTPLESKELNNVLRISSHESTISIKSSLKSTTSIKSIPKSTTSTKSSHKSTISIKSNCKLPKNVRESLQNFKVNTHYRSRTRILRMTSKSCDGFKIKKSLYCTGFEFWSSKVRSKSYPSSASRRAKEKE